MSPRFRLSDVFLLTAAVAAAVATFVSRDAVVALIALACGLPVLWHRPVLLRLWLVAAFGVGAWCLTCALFMGGGQFVSSMSMESQMVGGWGAAYLVGGLAAYWLFVSKPPA